MRMQKKPAALMLVTALLSFGICESISRMIPSENQPPVQTEVQVQAAPMTTQMIVTEPVRPAKSRMLRARKQTSSNSDNEAALLQTDPVPDLLRPETEAGTEVSSYSPSDAATTTTPAVGPLDLGLVPSVVILPKKQEPLASSGLYDKKHQSRGEKTMNSTEKIFL